MSGGYPFPATTAAAIADSRKDTNDWLRPLIRAIIVALQGLPYQTHREGKDMECRDKLILL